uniref:Ycf36 n=1 Tax=Cyanoptyche gloeocystis TaxID=77922 RepID=A0A3G1IWL7_9EUKA|nr:hypothetical protein [Cyanoptyche gloeocystis]|mmetsp:Transcript_21629/g.37139  ORF Transcript_21629/g.37139 Transcript_21629/m.37139 type:complete len:160 (-) Transcript_21629:39-518(-)
MLMICPVPLEQRPFNEFNTLKSSWLFCWPSLNYKKYVLYLFCIWFFGWIFTISLCFGFFSPLKNVLDLFFYGVIGGNIFVCFDVIRLYLGWSYVGNRLLSASICYEESGWYDGQLWVKTPELLIKDRLVAIYQVKPLLYRLKQTFELFATSLFFIFLGS